MVSVVSVIVRAKIRPVMGSYLHVVAHSLRVMRDVRWGCSVLVHSVQSSRVSISSLDIALFYNTLQYMNDECPWVRRVVVLFECEYDGIFVRQVWLLIFLFLC